MIINQGAGAALMVSLKKSMIINQGAGAALMINLQAKIMILLIHNPMKFLEDIVNSE